MTKTNPDQFSKAKFRRMTLVQLDIYEPFLLVDRRTANEADWVTARNRFLANVERMQRDRIKRLGY